MRRPARWCALPLALLWLTGLGAAFAATPLPLPAPDFTRTDLAGHAQRLSDYRGKVVLLNFWATWCEPCLAEIPQFSIWQRKYGAAGLQVLGLALDDQVAPVRRAYRHFALSYPVAMGDVMLSELYGGVLGLPLSFLIDQSGMIVARYQGEPDLRIMEERLRALLSSATP